MAKRQINIRASRLLERQLSDIELTLGLSKTEAITIAIDRMYQTEFSEEAEETKAADPLVGLPLSAGNHRR